jgi:hypothetical protein
VQTVTEAAEPATGAAGDTAGGAVQTVTEAAEPVTGAVAPVTDTVSGQADALTGTVGDAAAGALQTVTAAGEPVTGSLTPLTDTVSGQADVLLADIVANPGWDVVRSDPGAVLGTGLADVAQPASESGGGVLGGLPFEALPGLTPGPEEALILSAGLVTLAGLALVARASGPSPASLTTARFFLSNAPLIPLRCMVRDTMNRSVSAVTAGATGLAGGVSGGKPAGEVAGAVAGKVVAVAGDFRDGFLRGADRAITAPVDGESNTPFWLIGLVLGTFYLAFMTVLVWARRLGWTLRH